MKTLTKPTLLETLDLCHRQILLHLDRLEALMNQLGQAPDATEQATAQSIADFFAETAQKHHQDEENHVFPALLGSGSPELEAAVRTLQQDHGWIEEDWIELAPQLRAIASGYNWYDADELRHAMRVFIDLMREHIALEDALVYPEARTRWLASAAAQHSAPTPARRARAGRTR